MKIKKKKMIILENINAKEISLVFPKIVSKGLCCDKIWGISYFSSCTPIRGIYGTSLLRHHFILFLSEYVQLSSQRAVNNGGDSHHYWVNDRLS